MLAAAFARAASGAPTKGVRGGGGGVKGAGGVGSGREERYYVEDGDGKNQETASAALTQDQVCRGLRMCACVRKRVSVRARWFHDFFYFTSQLSIN